MTPAEIAAVAEAMRVLRDAGLKAEYTEHYGTFAQCAIMITIPGVRAEDAIRALRGVPPPLSAAKDPGGHA